MHIVINILLMIIDLYWWVVIFSVVLSWLLAFGIVNPYNPTVRSIGKAISAFTEPVLQPIRRVLPDTGAIDVSPIFLLIGLSIIRYLLSELRFA